MLFGSGPAYFFLFMELLETGAIKLGLSPEQARLLTIQTVFGAAKMALESDLDPAQLRRQVTSPGGTTDGLYRDPPPFADLHRRWDPYPGIMPMVWGGNRRSTGHAQHARPGP